MAETVDLSFLAGLAQQTLLEMRDMRSEMVDVRKEMTDVRTLCLLVSDHTRRIDRRLVELRDDIELIVRSEIMGRLAQFETREENTLAALTRRVEALEARTPN